MLPASIPDIFLDTDVAFDIISKREPFFYSSVKFLELAAANKSQLLISESSLANLFYLTFDIYKLKNGVSRLTEFINVCQVVNGGKAIALSALQSSFKDKEDALQYLTAKHAAADYFITRNSRDYKRYSSADLPVYLPVDFFKEYSI